MSSSLQKDKPVVSPAKPQTRSYFAVDATQDFHTNGTHRGVMVGANFAIALESLWSNKLRSLLTGLGIFIGVAAVIAALTLTQGAGQFITSNIASLGTNVVTIIPGATTSRGTFGGAGTTQSLTPQDAIALEKLRHVASVSPIISVSSQVVFGKQNWNTRVQGVNTAFQDIEGWEWLMESGLVKLM